MQAEKGNIHKLTWNQYKSDVKATEAVRNINSRLAQEAVNNRMAKWWFREFRQERQSIKLKTAIKTPIYQSTSAGEKCLVQF